MVLRLRSRSFHAQTGQPVRVRFRLTGRSMAVLKRERKVRMRGLVLSRDSLGNGSTASFRFVLKAPPGHRRGSASAGGAEAVAAW